MQDDGDAAAGGDLDGRPNCLPRTWSSSRARSFLRAHSAALLSAWFVALTAVALGYFASGFFLTRYELNQRQVCTIPVRTLTAQESAADGRSGTSAEVGALSAGGCWYPRQYDRVVILLVDALRFDFVVHNASLREDEPRAPYANELPILASLLESESDAAHSSLFRFVADPPTVTMQRIKGITTGGLPTFIDIKDNFGGAAITEDNWISQLSRAQRTRSVTAGAAATSATPHPANVMHFFGDDTWFDLYPPETHFSAESRAYPSFNVADLHTVDNGCRANLEPMLAREMARLEREAKSSHDPRDTSEAGDSEWDVALAHFLGVDHVGHRFGPHHPEMKLKLAQMNQVIEKNIEYVRKQRQVNEMIRKRTSSKLRAQEVLFVVMGDHGMTEDGNHGGQTPEEIYAGLFMYSTKRISQRRRGPESARNSDEGRILEEIRGRVLADQAAADNGPNTPFALPPLSPLFTSFLSIPQIDFVPSISLLLGLPIPFGSLGKVIPELFWGREDEPTVLLPGNSSDDDQKLRIVVNRFRSFLPLLQALRVNALQVHQYFHVYSTQISPSTFGPDLVREISVDFEEAERAWETDIATLTVDSVATIGQLEEARRLERVFTQTARAYYAYLHTCAEVAKGKWTSFNYPSMYEGLILLAFVVLGMGLHVATRSAQAGLPLHVTHPMYARLYSLVLLALSLGVPTHLLALAFPASASTWLRAHAAWIVAMVVCGAGIVSTGRPLLARLREHLAHDSASTEPRVTFQGYAAIIVAVLYIQGQFSNMFIENEASVAFYSATIIACSWLYTGRASGIDRSRSSWRIVWLTILIASMHAMTFAATNTAPDANYQDANKFTSNDVAWMVATLVTLPALSGGSAYYLRQSLSSSAVGAPRMWIFSLIHHLLQPIAFALIFIFWSLPSSAIAAVGSTAGSSTTLVGVWTSLADIAHACLASIGLAEHQAWVIRVVLPRCVYTLALTGIGLLLCCPSLRFARVRKAKADDDVNDETFPSEAHSSWENGSQATRRRKDALAMASRLPEQSPLPTEILSEQTFDSVDRATVLSLQCHALLTLLSLPLMLVWGPKSSVVLVAAWFVTVAFLRLTSSPTRTSFSFSELLFWLFVAVHVFYATGHAISFASLPVGCAFIGFDVFNYYIGGALLMTNVFGNILLMLGITLTITAIRLRAAAVAQPTPALNRASASTFSSSAASLLSWLLFLTTCRALFSTINVFIQRRHLMVWAIFAPKFMFDAVFTVVMGVATTALTACATRWTSSE